MCHIVSQITRKNFQPRPLNHNPPTPEKVPVSCGSSRHEVRACFDVGCRPSLTPYFSKIRENECVIAGGTGPTISSGGPHLDGFELVYSSNLASRIAANVSEIGEYHT